jgi:hypothetical protein
MRIPAFPALFGLCVIVSSASAQVGAIDPLSTPSGTQARIIGVGSSTDFIKPTVIDVNRDSVRYQLNRDAGTKSLAWQRISRMDVSGESHSVSQPCNTDVCGLRALAFPFGGLIGALVGEVVGMAIPA